MSVVWALAWWQDLAIAGVTLAVIISLAMWLSEALARASEDDFDSGMLL